MSTATGSISLVSDVLTFSGTSTTGNFVQGMQRVTIAGVPAVNALSLAQSILSSGLTAPCVIPVTDPRVTGS